MKVAPVKIEGWIPLIQSGTYLSWSEEIRSKLQKLTLQAEGTSSGMQVATYPGNNPLTCVAFLDGEPIGWSLYADHYFGRSDVIMVYVHPSHRRRGVGQSLARAIHGASGKEVVSAVAWSQESKKFYEAAINSFLAISLEVDSGIQSDESRW
jgi:ribosomal protein S18 acetylase RimI-like enzyme